MQVSLSVGPLTLTMPAADPDRASRTVHVQDFLGAT